MHGYSFFRELLEVNHRWRLPRCDHEDRESRDHSRAELVHIERTNAGNENILEFGVRTLRFGLINTQQRHAGIGAISMRAFGATRRRVGRADPSRWLPLAFPCGSFARVGRCGEEPKPTPPCVTLVDLMNNAIR
jgi:hypothetical protein